MPFRDPATWMIAKATIGMHHRVTPQAHHKAGTAPAHAGFSGAAVQILPRDILFSLDSSIAFRGAEQDGPPHRGAEARAGQGAVA